MENWLSFAWSVMGFSDAGILLAGCHAHRTPVAVRFAVRATYRAPVSCTHTGAVFLRPLVTRSTVNLADVDAAMTGPGVHLTLVAVCFTIRSTHRGIHRRTDERTRVLSFAEHVLPVSTGSVRYLSDVDTLDTGLHVHVTEVTICLAVRPTHWRPDARTTFWTVISFAEGSWLGTFTVRHFGDLHS